MSSFDVLFTQNIRTGEYDERDSAKDVSSFSLYGAIVRSYEPDRREFVLEKLRSAIRQVTGRTDNIAQFNNHPQTTHRDILSVLKIANV